jgi:hypothetical protein
MKQTAVKSDGQFLFTAPVMIPETPDCDYHRGEKPFTAEEIRFFKESFDDYQLIDKEHQVYKDLGAAKTIADPVDSFILNEDTTYSLVNGGTATYPAGTWMLTSNVTDPVAQKEIMEGKLTGYSPTVHREEVGKLVKRYMAAKASAGQLIHDIPNPNTITVSIVGKPCQQGSKQCKIGSDIMGDEKKTLDKIREILTGTPEEYATKSDFEALAEEIKKDNEAAMKSFGESMANVFAETIKEALSEVGAVKSEEEEEEEEIDPQEEEEEEETKPQEEEGKPPVDDGSKQGKVHNGGAAKSDYDPELDTYAFLGRHPDGTAKRK